MTSRRIAVGLTMLGFLLGTWLFGRDPRTGAPTKRLDPQPKPILSDPSVKYDYDIVYVRAPRKGDDRQILWADVFQPLQAEPGSDLVLLHPNGTEEVLVAAKYDAVADPFVSFDGQWVYYALIHNVGGAAADLRVSYSSDIFKIHVKSKKIVQLTHQEFTPNTGVADPKLLQPGVYNMGPCPVPGGKIIFTSNRNGFISTKDYRGWAASPGYTGSSALQLFTMDEDGGNVEMIGHLNINGALHPTILKDGRVMFTTFESEAMRDVRMWSIWTINPDGTNWGPLFSALGAGGETARHFMTQLSDGNIIAEEYYFQQTMGFGTYFKMSPSVPEGQPFFGSAAANDPRNIAVPHFGYMPFSPHGIVDFTPFSLPGNAPAYLSDPNDPKSPRLGKVTHPSGAPDNNLLTVWSPGPVHGINGIGKGASHPFASPAIDSGLYLIKGGKPVEEPGQMLLIKNDPNYNEQWPRALVPYKRIHGVDEPARLTPFANDGKIAHLPEGSPYGLIGSSSLYKRESYPLGGIPDAYNDGKYPGGKDPYQGLGAIAFSMETGNWFIQGADAGKYSNSDIHAVRILVTVPTTDPRFAGRATRGFWNIANERLRILGEFPVRKFTGDKQPVDPDGNPDTSFLVKLPADVAWTFQTLDKHGMVLNMAQTWHQVRPGEMRTNCGGCHGHSQVPTRFEDTAAARPGYPIFDLTNQTPLITTKRNDQSGKKWDKNDESGLRFAKGVLNVEYFRDVKPILERSCVGCHTTKSDHPPGNLVLDDDQLASGEGSVFSALAYGPPSKVPGTFLRLALDSLGQYGYPSRLGFRNNPNAWGFPQASRYIRYFQSRRSLLVWKIFGQRLDGFKNEDFAYETVPGDPGSMIFKGQPFKISDQYPGNRAQVNLAYTGSIMPPPNQTKGAPLSDEDRLTIVRWIDLGCPIDLDNGHGWFDDENRPTLTLTYPPGSTRILIGMHDYDSGLNLNSFRVVSNHEVNGIPAGQNLAANFKAKSQGVWEMKLSHPLTHLTVSIKDNAGNETRINRTFSAVGQAILPAAGNPAGSHGAIKNDSFSETSMQAHWPAHHPAADSPQSAHTQTASDPTFDTPP